MLYRQIHNNSSLPCTTHDALEHNFLVGPVGLNPTQIKHTPGPRKPKRDAETRSHHQNGISKPAAQMEFRSLLLRAQVQSEAAADKH